MKKMSMPSQPVMPKMDNLPGVDRRRGETPSPVTGTFPPRDSVETNPGRWANTLYDVLLGDLERIFSAENQVSQALPPLARAASDYVLKYALAQYVAQIQSHLQRLNLVNELSALTRPQACLDLDAYILGGSELIQENPPGAVRDIGLICAVLKIEDFQIISYGCVHNLALILSLKEAAGLLGATLDEKFAASTRLRDLAEVINFRIED